MTSKLSQHWDQIQSPLFQRLEENLGFMTSKHRQLVTAIDFSHVEVFVPHHYGHDVGRPEKDRIAIAHGFIAKAVYNLPTTRALMDRLHCDPVMRRICGWETKGSIPSESTFSRAFATFARSELASRIHEAFIVEHHSGRLIGHIARDATEIKGREKAIAKPKSKKEKAAKKKMGRPKKGEERPAADPTRLERQLRMDLSEMLADLPWACDVGAKKNSKGFIESWKGYKLHIDTADGDIPISALLTSASLHDSQVALPLSALTQQRATYLYELMDGAYDAQIIREHAQAKGHVALIDFNHRSLKDQRAFAPHEQQRYKQRSSAERVNSDLKDNFGGRFVRVRGHAKVMTHLMFGLLAIAIEQTIRLLI